jgi:hypothetical protein
VVGAVVGAVVAFEPPHAAAKMAAPANRAASRILLSFILVSYSSKNTSLGWHVADRRCRSCGPDRPCEP